MASQSRKARGRRTEKVLALYYNRWWPFAEATGAGRSGVDVTGMPGLAIEVKARRAFEPVAWLKQAETRSGVPFVVFRPNGMGEQSVGKWGVLMTVEHHTQLLIDAGYGSTEGVVDDRPEGDEQERDDHHALDVAPAPGTENHNDKATPSCTSSGSSREVGG